MTFLSFLIRNWEKKPKHFFVCHWTLHYAHQLITNFVCHHSHLVQSLEAMGVKQSKMKGWNGKANSWKTNSFREPAGSGENAPWVNHFMQCQSIVISSIVGKEVLISAILRIRGAYVMVFLIIYYTYTVDKVILFSSSDNDLGYYQIKVLYVFF